MGFDDDLVTASTQAAQDKNTRLDQHDAAEAVRMAKAWIKSIGYNPKAVTITIDRHHRGWLDHILTAYVSTAGGYSARSYISWTIEGRNYRATVAHRADPFGDTGDHYDRYKPKIDVSVEVIVDMAGTREWKTVTKPEFLADILATEKRALGESWLGKLVAAGEIAAIFQPTNAAPRAGTRTGERMTLEEDAKAACQRDVDERAKRNSALQDSANYWLATERSARIGNVYQQIDLWASRLGAVQKNAASVTSCQYTVLLDRTNFARTFVYWEIDVEWTVDGRRYIGEFGDRVSLPKDVILKERNVDITYYGGPNYRRQGFKVFVEIVDPVTAEVHLLPADNLNELGLALSKEINTSVDEPTHASFGSGADSGIVKPPQAQPGPPKQAREGDSPAHTAAPGIFKPLGPLKPASQDAQALVQRWTQDQAGTSVRPEVRVGDNGLMDDNGHYYQLYWSHAGSSYVAKYWPQLSAIFVYARVRVASGGTEYYPANTTMQIRGARRIR